MGAAWEHRRAVDQLRLGVARLRSGRAAEAVCDLQTARRLLGDDAIVLLRLRTAAAEAGQLELAADSLLGAVRADPASVTGWLHKARLHRLRGEWNDARASCEQVLMLDPAIGAARRELLALPQPAQVR